MCFLATSGYFFLPFWHIFIFWLNTLVYIVSLMNFFLFSFKCFSSLLFWRKCRFYFQLKIQKIFACAFVAGINCSILLFATRSVLIVSPKIKTFPPKQVHTCRPPTNVHNIFDDWKIIWQKEMTQSREEMMQEQSEIAIEWKGWHILSALFNGQKADL